MHPATLTCPSNIYRTHQLPWAQRMAVHRLCCPYLQYSRCPRCSMDVSRLTYKAQMIITWKKITIGPQEDRLSRIIFLAHLVLTVGNLFATILLTTGLMANYPSLGYIPLIIFTQHSCVMNYILDPLSSTSSTPYSHI